MASQQPAAERPERIVADLLALLAIADQAIAMHDRADAVLRACAAPGTPPAITREGCRIAGEYRRLGDWSFDFAPHAEPCSLERRLSHLLLQHCRLLRGAARLASREHRPADVACPRRALDALGPVAVELQSVRDEVDLWITARTPAG
jgi:hypothetical protein